VKGILIFNHLSFRQSQVIFEMNPPLSDQEAPHPAQRLLEAAANQDTTRLSALSPLIV